MDQINEKLDRLAELSADEISTLQEEIVKEFESLSASETLSREIVDQMTNLGVAAESLRGELARRESEVAELATAAEQAAALVTGGSASTDAVEDEAVEEDEEALKKKKKKDEEEEEIPDAPEFSASEVETPEPVEESTATLANAEPEVFDSATDSVEEFVAEKEDQTPEVGEEETPEVTSEDVPESVEEVEVPTEESETTVEDAPSIEQEDSEETVTAAANTEGLNIEVPSDRRPLDVKTAAPVTITAGADIPGIAQGATLPNLRAVAQAILDRRKGMGRTSGGDGEQSLVATFNTSFPDSRTLISNDFEGNSAKIDGVVSEPALVAAGGLCAPVDVSYEIFGLGELGRPVRDSLAVFGADRGGIRFVTPPVISDLEGAVSVWTLQDDIDAATDGAPSPVKPCIRVACGEEVTVYTDAIPLCLTFGNLGARAWPELVERHTQLAMIWHARFAETRLLTRIGALSTAVTSEATLGAARDIFVAIERAAAAYRNRHRMSPDAQLRVIFPEWFKNALRADLTMQIPGDSDENTFALADATINRWFSIRGINVTWTLDGETGQIHGEQAAGVLNDFPDNVVWYLFAEGTFLFLDGGTLDLGLVRDSTLNGTNDYKVFLETFEGVAKVGIESLRVTTELAIAGASASTVDTIAATATP